MKIPRPRRIGCVIMINTGSNPPVAVDLRNVPTLARQLPLGFLAACAMANAAEKLFSRPAIVARLVDGSANIAGVTSWLVTYAGFEA